MSNTDIVEFHPVRLGVFDTLNWSDTESLSMQKLVILVADELCIYHLDRRRWSELRIDGGIAGVDRFHKWLWFE